MYWGSDTSKRDPCFPRAFAFHYVAPAGVVRLLPQPQPLLNMARLRRRRGLPRLRRRGLLSQPGLPNLLGHQCQLPTPTPTFYAIHPILRLPHLLPTPTATIASPYCYTHPCSHSHACALPLHPPLSNMDAHIQSPTLCLRLPTPMSLSEYGAARVRPAVVRITAGNGVGTGFIFQLDGDAAYVMTNHHVIAGYSVATVRVRDRTDYNGAVIGADSIRDLAVIRICCGRFTSVEFAEESDVVVGFEIVNIGYALALSGQATVSTGIISAVRYDTHRSTDVIQTDASNKPWQQWRSHVDALMEGYLGSIHSSMSVQTSRVWGSHCRVRTSND